MRCLVVASLLCFLLLHVCSAFRGPVRSLPLSQSVTFNHLSAARGARTVLKNSLDGLPERSLPQQDRNRRNKSPKSFVLIMMSLVAACKRLSRESSAAILGFLSRIPLIQFILRSKKPKWSSAATPLNPLIQPLASFMRNHLLVSLMLFASFGLSFYRSSKHPAQRILEIPFSSFHSMLQPSLDGKPAAILALRVVGDVFYYTLADGRRAITRNVYVQGDLLKRMLDSGECLY